MQAEGVGGLLADEAAVDDAAAPVPPPKPLVEVDCVIFGYTMDAQRKAIRSVFFCR